MDIDNEYRPIVIFLKRFLTRLVVSSNERPFEQWGRILPMWLVFFAPSPHCCTSRSSALIQLTSMLDLLGPYAFASLSLRIMFAGQNITHLDVLSSQRSLYDLVKLLGTHRLHKHSQTERQHWFCLSISLIFSSCSIFIRNRILLLRYHPFFITNYVFHFLFSPKAGVCFLSFSCHIQSTTCCRFQSWISFHVVQTPISFFQ